MCAIGGMTWIILHPLFIESVVMITFRMITAQAVFQTRQCIAFRARIFGDCARLPAKQSGLARILRKPQTGAVSNPSPKTRWGSILPAGLASQTDQQMTQYEIGAMHALHQCGRSTRDISKLLNISQPTITRNLKKPAKRIGPKPVHPTARVLILVLIRLNSRLDPRLIVREMQRLTSTGKIACPVPRPGSVSRLLREESFAPTRATRRPALEPHHLMPRVKWCMFALLQPQLMRTTIYTDESYIEVCDGGSIHWLHKTDPRIYESSARRERYMLWGAVSEATGLMPLVYFPAGTTLDGPKYVVLLRQYFLPWLERVAVPGERYIMQQDN